MKDYGAFPYVTGAFPNVAAVNASAPDQEDGTPWFKDVVDDIWGARQAVISAAHLTPDGNSETASASQYLTALRALFGTGWGVQRGLGISNSGGDPTNDIAIAVGVALSAVSPYRPMANIATLTKRIDAVWSAGNNAGGRASATNLTGAKTFHLFLISTTSGSVDAGFDTSISATNLLADAPTYTDYCYIGSVLWDGSTIRPFVQYGEDFYLKTPVQDRAPTNLAASAVSTTLSVPSGLPVIADFVVDIVNTSGSSTSFYFAVSNSDLGDYAPSSTENDFAVTIYASVNSSDTIPLNRPTNSSGAITFRSSAASAALQYSISTRGWRVKLGN